MSDGDPSLPNLDVPHEDDLDNYQLGKLYLQMLLEAIPPAQHYHQLVDLGRNMLGTVNPWADTAANLTKKFIDTWIPTREAARKEIASWQILNSRFMAQLMWDYGAPKKGKPNDLVKCNDRLYTHNHDGNLNRIKSDDLAKQFEKGKDWPELVLTSNHALSRGSKDVSGIMKNISALIRQLMDGKLELERRPDLVESSGGKAIIVSAVSTEETAMRNGAALLYRYNFLKDNPKLDRRIRPHVEEGEKVSPLEAKLRGPSPAAIRLAKLMLKLMAEDPSKVDVDETRTFYDMAIDCELNGEELEPIVLRDDAVNIARHITLIGYSKAANTVSDAVRYLQFELFSKTKDGQALFSYRDEATQRIKPMRSASDVAQIVSQLGLIGIGGPGNTMTKEEKELGMRRVRIRSGQDTVSGHFDKPEKGEHVWNADTVHVVNGREEHLGHDPNHALGFELEQGYVMADEQALEQLASVIKPKFYRRANNLERSEQRASQTNQTGLGPSRSIA